VLKFALGMVWFVCMRAVGAIFLDYRGGLWLPAVNPSDLFSCNWASVCVHESEV